MRKTDCRDFYSHSVNILSQERKYNMNGQDVAQNNILSDKDKIIMIGEDKYAALLD